MTVHDLTCHRMRSVVVHLHVWFTFRQELIGMDWSGTKWSLIVILRIVKRLCFINLSNQPFDTEKFHLVGSLALVPESVLL